MVYLPHWPIPGTFGNAKMDFEAVFDRITPILTRLGNPHKKLSPSIHITGTNGKGSTASFLAKILQENGYSVNLYTSPHIHNCNERIALNGSEISDSYLHEIVEKVRIATDKSPITFFEAFTIMAILAFFERKSDFNIFEVGMGARIDATNIVENRAASIITPISFDHQEYLGDTIAKIAFEKAHILRPNTPLILGPQPIEALQIIELIANDQNSKIIKYNPDLAIPAPSLKGDHQYINASIAISCALNLENVKLQDDKIKQAIQSTKWPNRIEKITNGLNKFLSDKSEIYIDSAHNVGGAFALAKWIDETNEKDVKNIAIVGFSRDKCKETFLEILDKSCDEIIAVRVQGEPYPEETNNIKEKGEKVNVKITESEDLLEAFYYLSKKYQGKNIRTIICGSIHLARDVRKYGNATTPFSS